MGKKGKASEKAPRLHVYSKQNKYPRHVPMAPLHLHPVRVLNGKAMGGRYETAAKLHRATNTHLAGVDCCAEQGNGLVDAADLQLDPVVLLYELLIQSLSTV